MRKTIAAPKTSPFEKWKAISGIPDDVPPNLFWVSTLGNLFQAGKGYIQPYINNGGYYQVTQTYGMFNKKYVVHRLVVDAFLPNTSTEANQVAHLDGCKTNNHLVNLAWVTPGENNQHTVAQRPPVPSVKYTPYLLALAKYIVGKGWMSYVEIAVLCGLDANNLQKHRSGQIDLQRQKNTNKAKAVLKKHTILARRAAQGVVGDVPPGFVSDPEDAKAGKKA